MKLKIFNSNESIVKLDINKLTPRMWWWRSGCTIYSTLVCCVGRTGYVTNYSMYTENYVLPICMI